MTGNTWISLYCSMYMSHLLPWWPFRFLNITIV